MMNEFEILLSGTPDIKDRLLELRDRVLWNGPLDARSRAVAIVTAAIAGNHSRLTDVLVWAKQAGLRNEEISHIAAVAAMLRLGAIGPTTAAGNGQPEPAVASCC